MDPQHGKAKRRQLPGTQNMPTTTSPTERHIVLNAKLFYFEKLLKSKSTKKEVYARCIMLDCFLSKNCYKT